MQLFQGLFFLILGLGVLGVAGLGIKRGWLPCGPNGFKGRLEFQRATQPLLFWLMFAIYATGGLALTIFAVRLLTGSAAPLPLQ